MNTTSRTSAPKTSAAAVFAAAAFAILGATDALAHSGTKEEQDACTPDVFRLCSAQIPIEDRIVACLNKNMAKLSPACRAVMRGDSPKSKKKDR